MERGWNADGTRMERGWYADGTRMERGWNADGTRHADWNADGTRIGPRFYQPRSHELSSRTHRKHIDISRTALIGKLKHDADYTKDKWVPVQESTFQDLKQNVMNGRGYILTPRTGCKRTIDEVSEVGVKAMRKGRFLPKAYYTKERRHWFFQQPLRFGCPFFLFLVSDDFSMLPTGTSGIRWRQERPQSPTSSSTPAPPGTSGTQWRQECPFAWAKINFKQYLIRRYPPRSPWNTGGRALYSFRSKGSGRGDTGMSSKNLTFYGRQAGIVLEHQRQPKTCHRMPWASLGWSVALGQLWEPLEWSGGPPECPNLIQIPHQAPQRPLC